MSPMEIIFAVFGVVLLIVSCFLTKEKETDGDVMEFSEEVLELQKKEAEKLVQQVLDEKTEEAVVKADDYLSKISNEKIMAVNEFTDQIIEKIDGNHKEVVFLYEMLNQKEDELKHVLKQFEAEKQEIRETVDDVIKLSRQLKAKRKDADAGAAAKKASTVEKEKKTETRKKETAQKTTEVKAAATSENASNGQMEFSDMLSQDTQKDEILRLYKQGKSVMEISKSLGMGQGEVKLIIGLYGL